MRIFDRESAIQKIFRRDIYKNYGNKKISIFFKEIAIEKNPVADPSLLGPVSRCSFFLVHMPNLTCSLMTDHAGTNRSSRAADLPEQFAL